MESKDAEQLLVEVVAMRREIRSLTRAFELLRSSFVEQGKTVAAIDQKLNRHLQTGEHLAVSLK
jgi:hypothetical protein